MGTLYWLGTADAVQQVHTGSIDSVDGTPANNTFTVTIGGVAISQVGVTSAAATAAALVVLLNNSTHPYFAAVTWTNPSAGNIVGTADTAGVPFVAALTETGAGTGSVTDFAETTASAGPNHWNTANNWDTGAVPVNSDDVIIANSAVNICWGLDQNAVDLTSLRIDATYTGKIGLDRTQFATSANGATFSATAKDEYREDFLKIGWATGDFGAHFGPGNPSGSQRLKLYNDKAAGSETVVHNTATAGSESGMPPVRLHAVHASANIYIKAGIVGIAMDEPGETTTCGLVSMSGGATYIGAGTTITTYEQLAGVGILQAAATVTTVTCDGGTLDIVGEFTVTTLNVDGGTVNCSNTKSAGNAVTTVNVTAGTLDATKSTEPRTWATVNVDGGSLISDDNYLTITTMDAPAGKTTLQVT